VIVFTDGAMVEVGRGSSAIVILPLEPEVEVIEVSHSHSTVISSLETKIEAIALSLKEAIKYYASTALIMSVQRLFILTDCKSAIRCITQKSIMHEFHTLLTQVCHHLQVLHNMNVHTAISWIRGHSGIGPTLQ